MTVAFCFRQLELRQMQLRLTLLMYTEVLDSVRSVMKEPAPLVQLLSVSVHV